MKEWESLSAKMPGLFCWSMIGISAGSMFSLGFGEKLKRNTLVYNDHLREDQRKFIGEYTIFVRMTGWRLDQNKKLLCDCNDSNTNDGPMVTELRKLEGKKLLRFESGKSPAELKLIFSEGYGLVLSDWEGVEPEDEAYTVFGDGLSVTVQMNGNVSVEPSGSRVQNPDENR